MSFTYDFTQKDDTVFFAYCVPYTYTRLTRFIGKIKHCKKMQPLKTLSGLPIPVLEVTDERQPEYNKQVVLVTGRIHPGESNASFMAEGFLDYLCGNESTAKEIRKAYIFYVLPMINPDGVVAGNYRTSLFGKDLNRTFDQSRKYAFPQTFYLVELAKQLKDRHKKRFTLYIDLHGHSVKKNVFMYGPEFSIQHSNYEVSRQLPKILGSITSMFRYYSCIFRISGEKATTARAILNRRIDVPFTYTTQASNGFYVDPNTKSQMPFTSKKYREMGVYLCKSFSLLKFDQNFKIRKTQTQKIAKDQYLEGDKNSDDEISQGGSDSEPAGEDLSDRQLQLIQSAIQGKKQESKTQNQIPSPTKSVVLKKFESTEFKPRQRPAVFLPPINSLNRAVIFSNRSKKKEIMKNQRLQNIESQPEVPLNRQKPRYSLSQMMSEERPKQQIRPSRMRREMKSHVISILRMSK